MQHDIELTLEIGTTEISLFIVYKFIRGSPATGPSYSSGGEPADPDEVDIQSIDWAPVSGAIVGNYQPLESGTLFNIICDDEWVYNQICEAEYANH
jgi:acetamidase/formamidase